MIGQKIDSLLYTGGMENPFDLPQPPGRSNEDYQAFEDAFQRLSGISLSLYKEKQMRRRINTLMDRKHIDTYRSFLNHLSSDPAILADFVDYITINVTEFFRTPDHWAEFEKVMSAYLASDAQRPLRIWSCACSTGEEVYSLAMSMLKYLAPADFRILATDLDEKVLNKAKAGVYPEQSIQGLPEDIRDRYFSRKNRDWAVSKTLRSCVEFRKLDLLRDTYPYACDLIVCRNVLIYFTDEAKEQIYTQFRHSLIPGGYLFTGNAEQIVYYKKYGFQKIRSYLYKRN